MTINRIQFQLGLSMLDFLKDFGIEAQCQKARDAVRWSSGFAYPRCCYSGNRSHPLLLSSLARRQAPDSPTMCALAREGGVNGYYSVAMGEAKRKPLTLKALP